MTGKKIDEAVRAEIHGQVLEWIRESLEDPGIELADNFLDVGGHSLAAAHVNKQLEQRFGVRIPLRSLFESTVAEACDQAAPVSS